MKTIYFLRGLPASGKSTWAKTKLAALNRGEYKRAILTNKDEIRKRFQSRGVISESKIIQKETETVTNALKTGLHVIIDNTHFHLPHEARFRTLASQYGYRFVVQSFTHVPLEECVRRDAKRKNSVGEGVIRSMYSKYGELEAYAGHRFQTYSKQTATQRSDRTTPERISDRTMTTKKRVKQTSVIVEQVSTVELTKMNSKNSLKIFVRSGDELLGTLILGKGSIEWRPKKNETNFLKKDWKSFVALLEGAMKK